MKNKLPILILPLLFFVSQALADTKPTVKIGALLSLSGGLEQWCGYIRQGMEIGVSEDSNVKTEIIFEDDRSIDKKASVNAARKLTDIDKVDILFSWTAATTPVLIPVVAKAKVPLVVGAYDQHVASGGPWVFGGLVNYDILPREIADFLKTKNAKRLGLILAADDWSQGFEKPFIEEVKKFGGEIVLNETVTPTETNLRPLILKAQKSKVDAILAPLYSNSLYSFLKQARELKYTGIIHVGDGMFEEDIKIVGPDTEGVYAAQIWIESDELNKIFKKRFGADTNPLQLGLVAGGLDALRHVRGAVEELVHEGKIISNENIRTKLQTFKSSGFMGEQMFCKGPKQSGEITVVVKDGRYVLPKG